jgi:hypothetical protein
MTSSSLEVVRDTVLVFDFDCGKVVSKTFPVLLETAPYVLVPEWLFTKSQPTF